MVHRQNKLVEDEENVSMYRQNPQGNSIIRFTLALLLTDADDESEVVVVSVDWYPESEFMVVSVWVDWEMSVFGCWVSAFVFIRVRKWLRNGACM